MALFTDQDDVAWGEGARRQCLSKELRDYSAPRNHAAQAEGKKRERGTAREIFRHFQRKSDTDQH